MSLNKVRLAEGGVGDTVPGFFEGVGGEESGAVGELGEGVGVFDVRVLGQEDGDGVLDAEGVDVVGEGDALGEVDGVDDVVFGGVEMFGEEEDGEVGVEEGFFFFVIISIFDII